MRKSRFTTEQIIGFINLMNNPLSGTDPSGYVGCGDVQIKGGISGTCEHTLANGDVVDVSYKVDKSGNVGLGSTRSGARAILADNGARRGQAAERIELTDGAASSPGNSQTLSRADVRTRGNPLVGIERQRQACGSARSGEASCADQSDIENHLLGDDGNDTPDTPNPHLSPTLRGDILVFNIPYRARGNLSVVNAHLRQATSYWARHNIELNFQSAGESAAIEIRGAVWRDFVEAGIACNCTAAGDLTGYGTSTRVLFNVAPAGRSDGLTGAHEIGHLLGLEHRRSGIMVKSGSGTRDFEQNDGDRVRRIYGY